MTILLDANPDALTLGTYDATPFGHQIQPPLDYYQSFVSKPGGGTWSLLDFMKVVQAPWDPSAKAWMVTIFPATNYNGRERSELLDVGNRADPSNLAWQVFKNWRDDPNDPAAVATIYHASRRVFGDATYPWSGPVAGGVALQCKGIGYDDPDVPNTEETMNYQQGPIFEFQPRGSNFEVDLQGGILSMTFETTGQDYVKGYRNAWGRVCGSLVSGHVYDIIVELTLSVGLIASKLQPLPSGQQGGVRVWVRDWTVDQSDWSNAHLICDSFTQPSWGDTFTPDFIPATVGPRAVGSIEEWNYQGSSGEVYPLPATNHPVAAAALTGGYMPPQHFTGRGIYRGGWVNGERNVHRTFVGKERYCTTLDEARALYGSGAAPAGAAPVYTASPTVTGTLTVGSTLTATAGTVTGSPTPTKTTQWQAAYDSRWRNLDGQTGSTLTLTAAHVGLLIRVVETASNDSGTASSASAATAAVPGSGGNWIGNPLGPSAANVTGWGPNQGTETLTLDTVT